MSMTQCPLVSELNTQRTLLTETLDILESNLGALRMGAINDERIDNHCRAIATIRDHLNNEMDSNDDTLQTNSKNVCKSPSPFDVPVTKKEEIKLNEHHLLNIIVDSITIPWDAAQSIKSIERRVQAAIQQRDFTRAGRLDNVSIAIRNVHNYCQELLNATR